MAFVDPNDPNAPNAPQNPLNQQAPISSGGAGVSGAAKPQNKPGVNVPAQPSAQLSAYLGANQPQAAAFGQNVAQDVGAKVNAAGAAIQPAVNTYTGNLYSVPTDQNVNAAVAASPSSLTPEQKATYKKELGAAGASPNSADTFETTQGYQDVAGNIQKAVSQADLWNSGNSVSSLTAALAPYESANATAGDRTLDSILLSRTPAAYDSIRSAVAPAAGFQDQLAAGTESADTALRAAIDQNQATTPAAQEAAQKYVSGLNTNLSQYLADAQNQANKYNEGVASVSSSLANVQPQIADLQNAVDAYNALISGGPSATGVPSSFSPIALSPYSDPASSVSAPGLGQVASPTQYSDIAALKALLGDSGFASLGSSLDPSTSAQAGTWSVPGTPPNVSMLLDPMFSSGLKGVIPALATLLGYSSGGVGTPDNTDLQNTLDKVFGGAGGAIATPGGPLIGGGLGAYFGAGLGADGIDDQSPNIQGNSPVGQKVRAIDNALMDLSSAKSAQPFPGAHPEPTPSSDAIAPAGGQPGNEAWYNFIHTTYPDLDGFPKTYQGYLDQFNGSGGGYHTI